MTAITTEPEFYDLAMTGAGEPAMLALEQSPWLELYRRASWLIAPSSPVVDLGCGTGRFAEQLRRRNHRRYTGLDFSPAALAECKAYVPLVEHDNDHHWRADFELCDLREWQPAVDRWPNTVYVCLETLEHLDDDRSLIHRVPVGHELIFSVPNFGGEAHLRVFPDASEARRRYGDLVEIFEWARIGTGPRYFIHLYRAVRRGDAW